MTESARLPILVFGTGNRKKALELGALVEPLGIAFKTLADFPNPIEVDEVGQSFAENAALKATQQAVHLGQWVLADDSGLVVDALGGAPGIYSARFAGVGASDEDNRMKLLDQLEKVELSRRTAHFDCHLALADSSGSVRATARGRCSGRIRFESSGTGGFGYDPLFEVVEYHRTFGELSAVVKSVLSHRARAMQGMIPQIAALVAAGDLSRLADSFDMIAKTFFGLEGVLADELQSLGAADIRQGRRMVSFTGDMRLLVRANVYCRTAVRILKPIATFSADNQQSLYDGVSKIDWSELLSADSSLAVDPVVRSEVFSNSLYAAQLAKDAIVDQFRSRTGGRPSVDLADPDLRINLHISGDRVTVYLDASGDSLHKRGYRTVTGEAPINEVLAAGILRLTGWDQCSPLVDFMCGSGTFAIEAAMAARRIAPGLVRQRFGYQRWKDFDSRLHESVLSEARAQVLSTLSFPIQGSDLDPRAIAAARANAERAGVAADVALTVANFEASAPPAPAGTLVTNPPYDERMKTAQIGTVYGRIGDVLKRRWHGYTAYVLSGNLEAAKHFGLRPSARIRLFNGPIECRLLKFDLFAARPDSAEGVPAKRGTEQFADFHNRLTRMAKHWHRWARRQDLTCYRLFDRDIPDVPLAIDWLEGHVLITENDRPHGRTGIEHREWLEQMVRATAETLEVDASKITLQSRLPEPATGHRKQRPPAYSVTVREGDLRFEVHLEPGCPLGLDLDKRNLRCMLRDQADGKRFLHLFASTGTLAVAAAAGGAESTLSVEASRDSVDRARKNLKLNDMAGPNNRLLCQDPHVFVKSLDPRDGARFDLAVIEPPGFDGHRREGVWNVQDDHAELLNAVLECMSVGGRIYFASTFQRLTIRTAEIRDATVREITKQIVPPDFRKRVRRVWVLMRTDPSVSEIESGTPEAEPSPE